MCGRSRHWMATGAHRSARGVMPIFTLVSGHRVVLVGEMADVREQGSGAPCRVRRAGTGRLAGQRGLTRGKWKSLRPSPAAVEADDERFIVLDWLDEGQAGRSRHCYGGGQRVGETEVGAGHAGGGSARGRAPTMRVDQVTAPLVAARGGDPPGEFDDLGETAG